MTDLRKLVGSLSSDTSGNISLMFAGIITAALIGVGAAIDYSGMVSKRQSLQHLADGVVLAAATSNLVTEQEIQKFVDDYVLSLGYDNLSVKAELTPQNTIVVTPTDDYNMFIMGMFNDADKTIIASSEAPLASGGTQARLALVLDTTRSMKGEKIIALQSASSDLLDELKKSNEDGRENIKVSFVPFSRYVRISESNRGQNWLELQPDQEVTWKVVNEEESTNCRQVGEGEGQYTECDEYVYDEKTEYLEWEGCMASRPDDYHKVPDFTGGRRLQGFVAHASCNAENSALLPLTSDLDHIHETIQNIHTQGSTYIPAGLIWGWRTLDSRLPFPSDTSEIKTNTQDVLLLMTDGANSASLRGTKPDFSGIYHWGSGDENETQEAADALTAELCSSIKEAGIRIITVAFQVDDEDTKNMLNSCASSLSDYYDAASSEALKDAFKDIGSGLSEIRLMR